MNEELFTEWFESTPTPSMALAFDAGWQAAQSIADALRHRIRVHLANRYHYSHSDFCTKLEEILAEHSIAQPAQVPAGYKLAPIEPTPGMSYAGLCVAPCGSAAVYKAMIAAAPEVKP